jgi:hypothetical protein
MTEVLLSRTSPLTLPLKGREKVEPEFQTFANNIIGNHLNKILYTEIPLIIWKLTQVFQPQPLGSISLPFKGRVRGEVIIKQMRL